MYKITCQSCGRAAPHYAQIDMPHPVYLCSPECAAAYEDKAPQAAKTGEPDSRPGS